MQNHIQSAKTRTEADYDEIESMVRRLYYKDPESDFDARMRLSFQIGCLKAKLFELHLTIIDHEMSAVQCMDKGT